MSFRDFFNKYKILTFILYTLAILIAIIFIQKWWINLLLSLPSFALGIIIMIGIFPKKDGDTLTVICADGLGTVQVTSGAIAKALRDATNAVEGAQFKSSLILNEKAGLIVKLNIRISFSRVLEISEVVRVFTKKVLEKEMNVRVAKIDIVVSGYSHAYKVDKIAPETDGEEGISPVEAVSEPEFSHSPDIPAYKMRHGGKETTFYVPNNHAIKTRENMQEPAISVPAPVGAPAVSKPAPVAGIGEPKPATGAAASAPAVSRPAPAARPAIGDPHKDIEEVALPSTTPQAPQSRAELLQQQREETARRLAELKAKQEARKNK